jgi:hypothetical protein
MTLGPLRLSNCSLFSPLLIFRVLVKGYSLCIRQHRQSATAKQRRALSASARGSKAAKTPRIVSIEDNRDSSNTHLAVFHLVRFSRPGSEQRYAVQSTHGRQPPPPFRLQSLYCRRSAIHSRSTKWTILLNRVYVGRLSAHTR